MRLLTPVCSLISQFQMSATPELPPNVKLELTTSLVYPLLSVSLGVLFWEPVTFASLRFTQFSHSFLTVVLTRFRLV